MSDELDRSSQKHPDMEKDLRTLKSEADSILRTGYLDKFGKEIKKDRNLSEF